MWFLFGLVFIAGLSPLIVLPVSIAYNSECRAYKMRRGICTEPGCWRHGDYEVTACYYPGNYDWDSPDDILCYDHIDHSGFCRVCGQFWGGIESFEFIHPGYCGNCWREIRSNDDDWYDDYDEYGDFDPYDDQPWSWEHDDPDWEDRQPDNNRQDFLAGVYPEDFDDIPF